MRIVAALAFVAVLASSTDAAAQDAAALIGEIKGARDGLARAETEFNQAAAARQANAGAFDTYVQRKKAHDADVANWSGYCSGTFPEPEYSRRKARCGVEIPRTGRNADALNRERARLLSIVNRYDRAVANRAFARNRLNLLLARARISAMLGNCSCGGRGTPEAEAQCYVVCWERGRDPGYTVPDPPRR